MRGGAEVLTPAPPSAPLASRRIASKGSLASGYAREVIPPECTLLTQGIAQRPALAGLRRRRPLEGQGTRPLDRDRLRQQVLEDRQWVIHRIWSTDWFKNSNEQLKRALAAIEDAKAGISGKTGNSSPAAADCQEAEEHSEPDSDEEFECDAVANDPVLQIVTEYKEAELRARTDQPLHDVPVAGLAQIAVHVVQVEAPVHRDEVTRRIASFWGHRRVSGRMSAAVERALEFAVRQGALENRGDFYFLRDQREIPVRSRESVISGTLRSPEMLPPEEIRKAVLHIVQTHLGAANDEIIATTSRVFGFRSTGPKIRQAIAEVVNDLLANGSLREREDRLYAS